MIRLDLNAGPEWLDLGHGVRLKLLPLTTALMAAARADDTVENLPEDTPDETRAIAFAKAIARRAVIDWSGIGDEEGEPLAPTPKAIDALLDIYPLFEAFQLGYVARGLVLDQEKNASSPLPNGTLAGASDTARPASPSATAPTARPG